MYEDLIDGTLIYEVLLLMYVLYILYYFVLIKL